MKTPEILLRILIKDSIPENNEECCCICERKFIIVYKKNTMIWIFTNSNDYKENINSLEMLPLKRSKHFEVNNVCPICFDSIN